MSNVRAILCSCLILLSVGGAVYAAQPVIQGVSIPDVSMKINDAVTVTITVQADAAVFTMNASNIGGYALSGLSKQNDTTYEAQFTVTSGGTDYAAGADIPTSVELEDSGLTDTWSTAISQANDPIDANRPNVTIDQAGGQADPTNASPVTFTVVFDEPINDATFTNADVSVGGTATTGAVVVTEIAPNDDTTFEVSIVVSADGTVVPTIPAGGVEDPAGNTNNASTSTDNSVTVDTDKPSVTIDQAGGQADPTNGSPVLFTAVFDEPINDATFTLADVSVGGTATTGLITVTEIAPNDDTTFEVSIVVTADGTVVPTIPAGGVQDPAGNTNNASTSTDNSVTYDATKPDVTIDQASGQSDPTNASPVAYTVVFDEPVDDATFTNVDVSVGGTATTGLVTVTEVAPNDDTTFEVTIVVTADGTVIPTIPAGGVEDSAGNTNNASTSTDNTVTVDTVSPEVDDLVLNDVLITDADTPGNASLLIRIQCSEAMDQTVTPTVIFAPTIASTLTWDASSGWDSSTEYHAFYDVADGNVDIDSVTIDVEDLKDLAGNDQQNMSPWFEIEIDTLNPTVTGVSVDTDPIYEGDTELVVTVDFDEPMTGNPVITFSGGTWVSLPGGGYTNGDTRWTETFALMSTSEDISGVTIGVSGTQDTLGNAQQTYTPQAEFDIDTVNPTVVSVEAAPTPVSDAAVGSDTFTVSVVFDETMDSGTTPWLEFSPDVVFGAVPTLSSGTGSWSQTTVPNDTFTMTYDVSDQGVDEDSVTIDVEGGKDAAGNDQEDYSPVHEFEIDTLNPSVTTVVIDTNPMYEGDLIQQVTVTFDEAMDTATDPTLSFGAGTFASNSDGAWSVGDTVWTETFTLTDNDEEIAVVTVDVTGAKDAAGNDQEPYAEVDEFDIDTVKPSVTTVAIDTDPMYEGDLIQQVTVTFDEAMDTGTDPTISFGAGTFASNSDGAWSIGNTVWTETFTLTDNNEEITAVTVDVTGAKDAALNNQEDYTAVDEFDIDTVKPTVTGVTVDDTLLSDSDAGTTLTVTVNFSEPMIDDGSNDPTLTFDPAVGSTLAFFSDSWPTSSRYEAVYTVSDAGVDEDSVTIDATGTFDVSGNPQENYAPLHEFEIDTLNPTVTSLVISDSLITDADVGDTFTVTIDYSEPMGTTTPSIAFSPSLDTTLSLQPGNSEWTDTDTYVFSYTILDGNTTVLDDDITITNAQDLAGNVQVAFNYDDQLDVDTENPYFHDFTVTGGAVDASCQRVVTFTAKVTDPNGTMVAGDITISNATVTNTAAGITVGDVYDISQTSDNQTTITITGKVDIEDLTGCPATVTITLDAVDSVDNDATQQSQFDDVVDTIIPVINDLRFDTDATHTAEQLVPYLVNECGLVTVYFSGNVTDNCCIVPANVNITATLPMLVGEGPAILEDFEFTPVQNGQGQVDFTGSAVVRCLESCPPAVCMSRVQINVTASDCCGNVAVPDSTGTGEGLVDDDILPIPRDDPRQDMVMDESAIIDPLVEVRLDEFGTYRLVLRESTPVRIDLMANDADNLSHNAAHPFQPCIACGPCGGQTGCCATMYIEDIVQHPSYGTATIEDDEGNCNGGTVIRYAPDRGYLGPDYFTYRIRDAFGNVSSVIATVYLQVVPEVWMEDVFVIACAGAPTEFEVSASDLFIDTDDPALIPFEFSLVGGPEHGVITGDFLDVSYTPPSTITDPQFGVQVPSLDFTEAASVTLWYTGASGYIGRDMARVQFDDPFGGSAVSVVDFTIGNCGATAPPRVYIAQGEYLPLITPVSFESIQASGLLGVTLTAHSDGVTYAAVSAVWSEDLNRYILILDTSGLPIGAYELRIPLGNDETVVMTIEVGEGE